MSTRITQPPKRRWPSGESFCVGGLSIRLQKVAERHELCIERYVKSGLGEMSGIACELGSGLMIFLEESEHAIEFLKSKGPAIYVDLDECVRRGATAVRAEVLKELDITLNEIDWVPEPGAEQLVLEERQRRNRTTR